MKKVTTIGILVLLAVTAYASVNDDTTFLAKLNAANINYVYSNEGRVTILRTSDTSEAIDKLLIETPKDIKVTVKDLELRKAQ